MMIMERGRPMKFKSPQEIEKLADEYFKMCDEKGKPYTITGLAIALDTDRKTLLNYEEKDGFFPTIKKIKQKVENYAEEKLFNGNNTAGVIFNLKNNYGWVDKQEIDTKVNMSYEEKLKQVADDNEY
jgi:hypothetical protein